MVRRAMLLTIFASDQPVPAASLATRLAPLRLGPFSVGDAADVLLSAFVEKPGPVLDYLRREGVSPVQAGQGSYPSVSSFFGGAGSSRGGRRVTAAEVRMLAEEVAVRCLLREGKGKTLKRLCETYPSVRGRIVQAVLGEHALSVEEGLSDGGAGWGKRAKLARHMGGVVSCEGEDSDSEWDGVEPPEVIPDSDDEEDELEDGDEDEEMGMWTAGVGVGASPAGSGAGTARRDLGGIGLEPLTTMIRRDEMQGTRARRRYYPTYGMSNNSSRVPPGECFFFSFRSWRFAFFFPFLRHCSFCCCPPQDFSCSVSVFALRLIVCRRAVGVAVDQGRVWRPEQCDGDVPHACNSERE